MSRLQDLLNKGKTAAGDAVDGVKDGHFSRSDAEARLGGVGSKIADSAGKKPVTFAYILLALAGAFAVLVIVALFRH